MAKRGIRGKLVGPIAKRIQAKNPLTKKWVKINTDTGKIISHKRTEGPYKNVRKKV